MGHGCPSHHPTVTSKRAQNPLQKRVHTQTALAQSPRRPLPKRQPPHCDPPGWAQRPHPYPAQPPSTTEQPGSHQNGHTTTPPPQGPPQPATPPARPDTPQNPQSRQHPNPSPCDTPKPSCSSCRGTRRWQQQRPDVTRRERGHRPGTPGSRGPAGPGVLGGAWQGSDPALPVTPVGTVLPAAASPCHSRFPGGQVSVQSRPSCHSPSPQTLSPCSPATQSLSPH